MTKQPVDPKYDPKRAGKYSSGNEGRLHPGLKHPGHFGEKRLARLKKLHEET